MKPSCLHFGIALLLLTFSCDSSTTTNSLEQASTDSATLTKDSIPIKGGAYALLDVLYDSLFTFSAETIDEKLLQLEAQTADSMWLDPAFSGKWHVMQSSHAANQGDYPRSAHLADTAKVILQDSPELVANLVNAYRNASTARYWLTNYEESEQEMATALEIAQANDLPKLEVATLTSLAAIVKERGDYDRALGMLSRAEKLAVENDVEKQLADIYNHQAVIYELTGSLIQAQKYHQKTLAIREQIYEPYAQAIAYSYNNIGVNYMYQSLNDRAVAYFQKTIEVFDSILPPGHFFFSIPLQNMSYCQQRSGRHEESIESARVARDIKVAHIGPNNQEIAKMNNILARSFLMTDQLDSALYYAYLNEEIVQEVGPEAYSQYANVYQMIAEIHKDNGDYQEALAYYQVPLESYDSLSSFRPGIQFEILDLHYRHGLDSLAYQQFLEMDVLRNKRREQFGEYHADDKELFYYLAQSYVAEIISRSQSLSTEQQLDSVRRMYEMMDETQSNLLAKNIDSPIAQLAENLFRANEMRAMASCRLGDPELTVHSFGSLEKYLGLQLRNNIRNSYALTFGEVPDSLIDKTSALQQEIDVAKNQLYELASDELLYDSLANELNGELFALGREKDELLQQLDQNFPDYYELKYDLSVATVEQVQTKLLPDPADVWLEYFVGDSAVYVYTITQDDIHFDCISLDFPLDDRVEELRCGILNGIAENPSPCAIGKDAFTTYVEAAHELYRQLLAPFVGHFPQDANLTIVPDDVLHYIPFEVLLTSEVSTTTASYGGLPYLLKDYPISYAYSATLQQEMIDKEHQRVPKSQILAMAPSFDSSDAVPHDSVLLVSRGIEASDSRNRLLPLRHNVAEVEGLATIAQATVLTGTEATKANLLAQAGDYRYVHLSTHAKANDDLGDYSFLAFTATGDSLANDWLYNRELYHFQLNADMVVLSACETALGELQRGEGLISLAHGFSYAGAKSLVASLWNVDDSSTKELMELFYQNLAAGLDKRAALQQAKLQYLEKRPGLAQAPFFWAAFVPVGDMSPVDLGQESNWLKWLPILLILLLGFGLFIRQRN